jgi:hypothetical protein
LTSHQQLLPKTSTYPVVLLQKIDALPRDVADELVVLVKVPPVHLLRLLSVGTLNLQKNGQARFQGGSEEGKLQQTILSQKTIQQRRKTLSARTYMTKISAEGLKQLR